MGGENHKINFDEAVWRTSCRKRARQDDRLGEAYAKEQRWGTGASRKQRDGPNRFTNRLGVLYSLRFNS